MERPLSGFRADKLGHSAARSDPAIRDRQSDRAGARLSGLPSSRLAPPPARPVGEARPTRRDRALPRSRGGPEPLSWRINARPPRRIASGPPTTKSGRLKRQLPGRRARLKQTAHFRHEAADRVRPHCRHSGGERGCAPQEGAGIMTHRTVIARYKYPFAALYLVLISSYLLILPAIIAWSSWQLLHPDYYVEEQKSKLLVSAIGGVGLLCLSGKLIPATGAMIRELIRGTRVAIYSDGKSLIYQSKARFRVPLTDILAMSLDARPSLFGPQDCLRVGLSNRMPLFVRIDMLDRRPDDVFAAIRDLQASALRKS